MTKRSLDILSTSPADLDPLTNIVLECDKRFKIRLYITGTHFDKDTPNKLNYRDHFKKIGFAGQIVEINPNWDQRDTTTLKSSKMLGMLSSKAINLGKFVLALGDRWELLPALYHWFLNNVPIIHLSGGNISYGAIDDSIRHAISKLAMFHLASNSWCRLNLLSLGEEDWRIKVVGEPGFDTVRSGEWRHEEVREISFNLSKEKFFLVTFHPCFFEEISPTKAFRNIMTVLKNFDDFKIIVTSPGNEEGSLSILEEIQLQREANPNVFYIERFGVLKFLKVASLSQCVIGNSSSFLIEIPLLKIPTVNVGNRQNGRLKPDSILDCSTQSTDIFEAVNRVLDRDFWSSRKNCKNPYEIGKKNVANCVADQLDDLFKVCTSDKLRPKRLVRFNEREVW